MVSKLAKMKIEQWWNEGLKPTLEDIILLNALGLKVENNSSAYDFSALPRVAFLGDYLLYEPTVYKQIWIDKAQRLISEDVTSRIYFAAYALFTPDSELPSLKNTKVLVQAVKTFTETVLLNFTQTQILSAIAYALNGNDPMTGEDWTCIRDEEKKEIEDTYRLPEEARSQAMQLICEASGYGLDLKTCEAVTLPILEKMVWVAVLKNGKDVMKDEQAQATGRFYQAAGKIWTRLKQEKEKENKLEK